MKKLILFLTLLFVGFGANFDAVAQYSPFNNLNYIKLLKAPPTGSVEDSVMVFDGSDSFVKMRPSSELITKATPTKSGVVKTNSLDADPVVYTTTNVDTLINKKLNLPTGFLQGLQLSINADPTKFNIAPGYYVVTDFTNLANPVVKIITYAGATGLTPAYLATANSTYVALDINGNVVSSASPFTNADRRTLAIIGNVVHSNNTTINVTNEIKAPIVASTNQVHDFMRAIGFLNEEGNIYSPNGANLQLNKSVGKIFGMGINSADYLNPHQLSIPAQTALTFAYRLRGGTQYANTTSIDPNNWDNAGVLTSVPVGNRWTIQRINLFQSGLTRIQYGQTVYTSYNDAVTALPTQSFVTEQNIADNAVFRCYLIVQQGTTNLQAAVVAGTALFVPVDKFGNVIGNGSVALTYANIVAALGYTPENEANKQNSLTPDGTGTKYPTVDAVNNGVILTNSTPQTKVGGFTSGGVNMTYTSDKWIALGTSVTLLNSYTLPMSLQLNVILFNYGVSGSTSNDLINHYSEIPTLTADNEKEYRLLSIEHGINDASQSVPLATFRANLEACIANAKGKGWTNKKILIINGNYCSRADLIISQPAYASEAILIAKEQGVQYVDIYNYTKNNGGGALLGDTVHPTIEGGKVYARGVVASMQGGGEFTNALSVVNGVNIGGNVVIGKDTSIAGTTHSTGSITTLGSIKTGYGTLNTPANTVTGDIIVPIFAGIITQHSQAGLIAKFTPIEDFGSGVFGPTIRNYVESGHISMYTAGTVRGSQRLAFRVNSNGVVETPFGINSASNVFTSEDFRLGFTKSLSYVGAYTNKITATNALGSVVLSSGHSDGTIDFNVSNGATNASNLALRINNNRSLSIPLVPTTSTGAYDILTRNTSTGVVEKVLSNTIATTASPTFTGTPTAPTAAPGTNTPQIATTAFVQAANSVIIEKTYAELGTMITNSELVKGQVYLLTDYMTTYTQPVTGVYKESGVTEQLYLTATDVNKFHSIAKSILYPQDIVYYEFDGDIGNDYGTEGFTKGKIYRRIDTQRNNDIGTDWRHVKYDRDGVDKLLFTNYNTDDEVIYNIIETDYLFNTVAGAGLNNARIGKYCGNNNLGSYTSSLEMKNGCSNNSFGSYNSKIKFGLGCSNNTIGTSIESFTLGDHSVNNTITGSLIGVTFLNNTRDISIIDNNKFLYETTTVEFLPTGTMAKGQTFWVTDALAPTYLGTLTGGGTVVCPVSYNGTAWVSH